MKALSKRIVAFGQRWSVLWLIHDDGRVQTVTLRYQYRRRRQ